MEAYRIVQWDSVHETAESRKLKHISWFAMPNKHDGLTFRQVAKQADGPALYGVWVGLLQVASKAPRQLRGWLIRNGKALSAEDIALMTGFGQEWVDKAIEYFAQPSVGWLCRQAVPVPADAPVSPSPSPGVPADAPVSPSPSPGSPLTEYRTVQGVQDSTKERERGAVRVSGQGPSLAAVQASRTQAGALLAQIKALELRKGELNTEERGDLRKKRALLQALQKKQAAGNFAEACPNV